MEIDQNSPIHQRLRLTVGIIYVLNLLGLYVIGLIIAYVKRADGWGTMWEGHFTFIIRTFWGATLVTVAVVIAMLLMANGKTDPAGPVLLAGGLLLVSVWAFIRSVAGLLRTLNDTPTPDPSSLFL